ncbi:hypothetical protein ACFWUP_05160 [Nocardia sp. NPDC058658]|uniref:hypothetical protein n=1 Tax=Nocardia sp. NPDC058658 TaxID=3346580 RepID=UPI003661F02E
MPIPTERVPTWVHRIAAELEGYLRAASALPPPATTTAAGWSATSPDSPVEGRSPWVHMSDIAVDCVGETIVLTFTWKSDDPDDAGRYLLPMTTMEADEITGSDALITRLDYFLDSHWRGDHTVDLGNGVVLAVMAK